MAGCVEYHRLDEAVEDIICRTKGRVVLALPLGIGKPNPLVNHLYQRIKNDKQYSLDIFTALSLLKPQGSSDLERRFLEPLVDRLYGNYPDLEYAIDMQKNALPSHIRVFEFFLKSGDWLSNKNVQQHYISSNYTHIARDMAARNPNVLAQAVAGKFENGRWRLSLSSNPDVSMDLIECLREKKQHGKDVIFVAMVNQQMPFMPGSAEVDADEFDIVIAGDECNHALFCTPNMKVSTADYAIGFHASSLVQDGGTLQIGIGSLGDAIAHALIVRDKNNAEYLRVMKTLQENKLTLPTWLNAFTDGLYGCSEMFVNGLLQLIQADVIRREVLDDDGKPVIFHGGFFIGPNSFYQALRTMPADKLQKIDMNRISFINQLYGDQSLKLLQRTKASFINTCMMVTLSGAAVSDGLDDGRVVSGVGGQYNFVAMAHEIPEARSILMLRSFRMVNGEAQSNIVTHYGHCTIPRHLRDIVVTEYGIADLRGKTDAEVIKALIAIADTRFQYQLRDWAVEQGKLEGSYVVPECYRNNTPEALQQQLLPYKHLLPDFPFGHDFTDDELVIVHALQRLKSAISHPLDNLGTLIKSLLSDNEVPKQYLDRMGFSEEDPLKEKLLRKLFSGNL